MEVRHSSLIIWSTESVFLAFQYRLEYENPGKSAISKRRTNLVRIIQHGETHPFGTFCECVYQRLAGARWYEGQAGSVKPSY